MKAFKFILVIFALVFASASFAQKGGNVVAKSYDISDNLDLQAVASIFGESKDLEDFERKLNDPKLQISNLDLNQDGYVDYLRVVEVAEGDTRVIVIQSVLGQDQFQDVATIELERQKATASSSTNVSIQIVGNPYIYGPNYIYEPYYYATPVFFDFFWMPTYRPYYSPWYWGYYPTYYSYWAPVPYYRYNRNVYRHINRDNRYVYTDTRRVSRADRMYSNVRGNSLERQNPSRSFESRNSNVTNRYVYDRERAATRSANLETSRGSSVTDRASFSSSRGDLTTGRNSIESTNRVADDRSNLRTSDASDFRSSTNRVRSDFNANRAQISREARVNISDNSRVNNLNSNSNINRTNTRSASDFNQSSNRIERSSRSSSNSSFNRSSSSDSFNRSSSPSSINRGAGSFQRSYSPAPSRSISAPSSSRGSSAPTRSIGR